MALNLVLFCDQTKGPNIVCWKAMKSHETFKCSFLNLRGIQDITHFNANLKH